MRTPHEVLKTVFGHTVFRPGQEEIITTLLSGQHTLAILPTGAGKSLCFQIPGLCRTGTTVVISPLISLMQDQVQALQNRTVSAEYLSSVQSASERTAIIQKLSQQQLQFIYVAPERLLTESFIKAITQITVAQLIIDEAHCISTWGHQFRPEYRKIANFKSMLSRDVPIGAFTATATPEVAKDIVTSLELSQARVFKRSFVRNNLTIFSFPCESHSARELALLRLIKKHQKQTGIVYAATRQITHEIQLLIQKYLPTIRCAVYHAGLSATERSQTQLRFIENELDLIVATNAFGMGVDKPNIRYVVHFQLSGNIENYYQEIGRAGRDGNESTCYLLSVPHDAQIQFELINQNQNVNNRAVSIAKLRAIVKYSQLRTCFHQCILEYFGEKSIPCENRCGNCLRLQVAHELLYGLFDTHEKKLLFQLLEKRSAQANKLYVPERKIASDKYICWQAFRNCDSYLCTDAYELDL